MYGAKIIKHVWQDDFAAARNAYMEFLPEGFVLSLDADELILPDTGVITRALAERKDKKVYLYNTYNYASESLSQFNLHTNIRLFYKDNNSKYIGRIHEQLVSSLERCSVSDSIILHYGYLSKIVQQKKKDERNTELLDTVTNERGDAFDFFNKGMAMMAYSRFQDAFDSFARYFEIQNLNLLQYYPSAYWQAARAALMLEKQNDALTLANKACESNLPEAFFVRGSVHEKMGQLEEALSDYIRASESTQSNETYKQFNLLDPSIKIWRANYMSASILENLGRFDEAEQKYKNSHEGDKKNVLPLLALAKISRIRGKHEQAISWAKKALECSDDTFEAKLEYVESLAAIGSFDEALEFAKLCVEKDNFYSALYIKLAELSCNGKGLDYFFEALGRYLDINPEKIDITVLYARRLIENDMPDDAIRILNREWPMDISDETRQKILIAKGTAHHMLGNELDALDAYSDAFELGEDNSELLYKIALSMAVIGRLEDSLAALDRLVVIDPDYPGIKQIFDLVSLKSKLLI
jgi:tetratricopeptide (TPR) repeat protein